MSYVLFICLFVHLNNWDREHTYPCIYLSLYLFNCQKKTEQIFIYLFIPLIVPKGLGEILQTLSVTCIGPGGIFADINSYIHRPWGNFYREVFL